MQFGSEHSQTNSVSVASKRSALSAIRSFTFRNRASVVARRSWSFTFSSFRMSSPALKTDERARELREGYGAAVERWPEPVARVAEVLERAEVDARVEEFPEGTPTAGAAATAVGSSRAQIVKSLVFICDGRPTLALVPGDRRADETKVATAAGARAARVARPDEVVAATGFEPGGVAPFPAPGISQVLMSQELLVHDRVWIGAGSERHMAGLAPYELERLTQARTADLT